MQFEWDQSGLVLWGLHWTSPQRVEGLHVSKMKQVESETLSCFPPWETHLSNKQMPISPGRPPPSCRFWVCESLLVREKWDSKQVSLSWWVLSPQPSSLVSRELALSVERCKAAKLGAYSEPSCKGCLFSSLNLRKLISQGFLASIYIPTSTWVSGCTCFMYPLACAPGAGWNFLRFERFYCVFTWPKKLSVA